MLVGDSNPQGDGRNPTVNWYDVGGPRGEEKWRPDKICAPESWEIRRGRWEGLSGKCWRGAEGDHLVHWGRGAC